MSSQPRIERRAAVTPSPALIEEVRSPLLARLLASRGLDDASQAKYGLDNLPDPLLLKGIDAALDLLHEAREAQWSILVVGDFDADGATSTALALRALRLFGYTKVDFLVPNRFTYGYGLTLPLVEVAAERRPQLIITVDNGVSNHRGVNRARELGIRVLITDHHLPGPQLPPADAIVNPNQPGCGFPSKALAGVGVIFYLMLALRGRLRSAGLLPDPEPNLAALLDLVALGTIADVVPLDHLNRTLVQQGLLRMRKGHASPGLQALCEVARRDSKHLLSGDLGFAIGPRLNAAGRLDDMALGIRCLLADNLTQARQLAERLDTLNKQRREIEQGMQEEALHALEQLRHRLDGDLPNGLVLLDPSWHQGVIGILASRIKERLHRPVAILTQESEGILRGSCRSIPGFHMRDALERIESRHPGLIARFGGHAMAAGLSLPEENFKPFALAFAELAEEWLSPEQLDAVLLSDGPLAADEYELEVAVQLQRAVPWGQAFPEPLFDDEFIIRERRAVGERHLRLQLLHTSGRQLEAIAFNVEGPLADPVYQRGRFAFRLGVNRYWNEPRLQLMVEAFLPN